MSSIVVGILLFSVLFENGHGFGQSRINQGSEVDMGDGPYMARIRIKVNRTKGGACDGSILSDLFVLTAGHCVTDETNMNVPNPPIYDPSNFSILVGTDDLNDESEGQVVRVSKVHFKEFSSKNDIAILQLSSSIMLDGVTTDPTFLPLSNDYRPQNRTKCHVDGWGMNPQNSQILLRADVYTISEEECNTGADAGRDRSHQICTLGNKGAGPCMGDSGGPLIEVSSGTQIGLVSLVPSNCKNPDNTIATFTAIAPNLMWIRSVMAQVDKAGSDESISEEECDDSRAAPV